LLRPRFRFVRLEDWMAAIGVASEAMPSGCASETLDLVGSAQ
jgi:hypothetical protein